MEVSRYLILAVAAVFGAAAGAASSIYLDSRRASRDHARKRNPEYFREIYIKTARLRDAIKDFDIVWEKYPDRYNQVLLTLVKILLARVADYNRAMSISTNPKAYLMPTTIEKKCGAVRAVLNQAVSETKLGSGDVFFAIDNNRKRQPIDRSDFKKTVLRKNRGEKSIGFEVRVQPFIQQTPFSDKAKRSAWISALEGIMTDIKRLGVD